MRPGQPPVRVVTSGLAARLRDGGTVPAGRAPSPPATPGRDHLLLRPSPLRIELTNPASVCILRYGLVPAAIECHVGGRQASTPRQT